MEVHGATSIEQRLCHSLNRILLEYIFVGRVQQESYPRVVLTAAIEVVIFPSRTADMEYIYAY
jgi:hypothetical protein